MTRHIISDSIYRIVFAAVAALILCAPSAEAQLVAMDFEDLAVDDEFVHDWGSTYTAGDWVLVTPPIPRTDFEPIDASILTNGLQHPDYPGSTAAYASHISVGEVHPICLTDFGNGQTCIVFEREDGQPFSMESIDISPVPSDGPATVDFQAILEGTKTFELRRNDRNFKEGDFLVLEEYEPTTDKLTSRSQTFQIGTVLEGKPHWQARKSRSRREPPVQMIGALQSESESKPETRSTASMYSLTISSMT